MHSHAEGFVGGSARCTRPGPAQRAQPLPLAAPILPISLGKIAPIPF